jgi:Ca2+-binding RTX toxin-like protein
VVEEAGGGTDRIESYKTFTLSAQVENLLLRGGEAVNGTGNTLANALTGNIAANVLAGLDGQDTLTGGSGNDAFVFNTALNATTNVDQITDFIAGVDKLHLDNAIFTAVGANGALAAAAFQLGAAALRSDDRIIYDQGTGALSYDADGSGAGAAIRFAILTTKPTLTSTDFLII